LRTGPRSRRHPGHSRPGGREWKVSPALLDDGAARAPRLRSAPSALRGVSVVRWLGRHQEGRRPVRRMHDADLVEHASRILAAAER
jgi:hypothetical protein